MVTVEVFGLGVRTPIHFTGHDAAGSADTVRRAWSRCLTPRGDAQLSNPITVEVLDDGVSGTSTPRRLDPSAEVTLRGTHIADMMSRLTQEVTIRSIGTQAGRLFMMHAGAVANPDTGAVVAFAAKGGTGKTTLSLQLSRRWCYVSDETVGVDLDGHVIPYEKPLSLRPGTSADRPRGFSGKHEASPDELELNRLPPEAKLHLAGLVLLERNDAHRTPEVIELDTLTAMVALAPETSSLSSLPTPLQWLADLLDSIGPVLAIRYAEASDVETLLAHRIRGLP